MATFKLEKAILDERWDNFALQSPDSTVFSCANYLRSTGVRLGCYFCLKGEEIRGACFVVESPDGQHAVADDLVVYSGVMMAKPHANQLQVNILSERFDVLTFFAAELSRKYGTVSFQLSPSITDIRPFLWHNYGSSVNQFDVSVRYTSIIKISGKNDVGAEPLATLYESASVSRRQQIRYAARDGIVCKVGGNASDFCRMYDLTMSRQSKSVSVGHLDRLGFLISALIKLDRAFVIDAYSSNGKKASSAVFGLWKGQAYYLFGASDPAFRSTPCGTAVVWEGIRECVNRSVSWIDLEGVNSPKRGWFKLSFGGELVPYFNVTSR